jgi:hypothetical protein
MNQGTEWGLLMKKNRSQKSRASVTLNHHLSILLFQINPTYPVKHLAVQYQQREQRSLPI